MLQIVKPRAPYRIQSWLLRRVQHITTHVNTLGFHFTLSHDKRSSACVVPGRYRKRCDKHPAILRRWCKIELIDSPRLWIHHAGRPQMTRQDPMESPVVDPPRRSSTIDTTMESPLVETPRRSSTSNNSCCAPGDLRWWVG